MASTQFSKRGAQARGISDDAPADPGQCGPCRGTGEVLSSAATGPELGVPHKVTCPWCEGTGKTIPGHDAQAKPAETPPVLTEEQLEIRRAALAEAAKARPKRTATKRTTAKRSANKKS